MEWVKSMIVHCDVFLSNDHLNVLELGKQPRHPKQSAIRIVNKQLLKTLKERLYAERKACIEENPHLSMLGADFVCVLIQQLMNYVHKLSTLRLHLTFLYMVSALTSRIDFSM